MCWKIEWWWGRETFLRPPHPFLQAYFTKRHLCIFQSGGFDTTFFIYFRIFELSSYQVMRKIAAKSSYIRYCHRVDRALGFFSNRPNWDPPPPHPQASESPSLFPGEDTLACGVLIRTRGQTLWYSRYICTLWGLPISSITIYRNYRKILTGTLSWQLAFALVTDILCRISVFHWQAGFN